MAALERLRRPVAAAEPPVEHCEICGKPVGPAHSHVADLDQRAVRCACQGCYLLFTHPGAARGRYRAIPSRYRYDPAPRLTAGQWAELGVPVRIAFFFRHTALGQYVCHYPGAAGAAEASIPQETWAGVLAANPAMADGLEPDVEALLVWRRSTGDFELYAVPIDACYELAGLVRVNWKDAEGGPRVWADIEAFLGRLRARSGALGGPA
ncbi:MAG: hypothetical protein QOI35_1094 [Cryptosporangiaceae bacterium]|jgi:hypothetical protein|nr:hypothetical protein [Cryptosporangiaceae bacterium]MDQ1658449.1 hypothetical protein [Cryptosporangiaceae bacterium]